MTPSTFIGNVYIDYRLLLLKCIIKLKKSGYHSSIICYDIIMELNQIVRILE